MLVARCGTDEGEFRVCKLQLGIVRVHFVDEQGNSLAIAVAFDGEAWQC